MQNKETPNGEAFVTNKTETHTAQTKKHQTEKDGRGCQGKHESAECRKTEDGSSGESGKELYEDVVRAEENPEKGKKKIGLYIFYGTVTVFLMSVILSFQDLGEIFKVVAGAHPGDVIVAVALLAVYAALYPLTVCILIRAHGYRGQFKDAYTIGMTEHFFNGITPFATGGQPFQVYAFNKVGIRPAQSSGVLLMNFIIHMIVTNIFAACSLFYYNRFASDGAMRVIAVAGFTINFLVLALMISLATSPLMRRALSASARGVCRIGFVGKFLEPKLNSLDEYFEGVQRAFGMLMSKKRTFLLCALVRAFTMALYYSVTFFILRALDINVGVEQLFFVICGTSFAITTVVFLPTPGSSGGIEFAFEKVFSSISGSVAAVSYAGMLLWRLMSYYLMMLISLAFYILLEVKLSKKKRR